MSNTTKRAAVALAAGALPLTLTLATTANPAAAIPPHAEGIAGQRTPMPMTSR